MNGKGNKIQHGQGPELSFTSTQPFTKARTKPMPLPLLCQQAANLASISKEQRPVPTATSMAKGLLERAEAKHSSIAGSTHPSEPRCTGLSILLLEKAKLAPSGMAFSQQLGVGEFYFQAISMIYSLGFCDPLLILLTPLQWKKDINLCQLQEILFSNKEFGWLAEPMKESWHWLIRFSTFNNGSTPGKPNHEKVCSIPNYHIFHGELDSGLIPYACLKYANYFCVHAVQLLSKHNSLKTLYTRFVAINYSFTDMKELT